MKSYRIFTNKLILLLIFSLVWGLNTANAVEKPTTTVWQINTDKKKLFAELKPSAIKQKERKRPGFQSFAYLPDRNTIGCILPLSGRYGDYRNKALDAILLAAGIFDEGNRKNWKIIAEDSSGIPEGGRAAASRLAETENVIAIIAVTGKLEAVEITREAVKWKIPLILITPKEGVASGKDYVFQHFLTSSQQIKALLKYALNDLNCAVFSILYPQDDYGAEMAQIFRTNRSSWW